MLGSTFLDFHRISFVSYLLSTHISEFTLHAVVFTLSRQMLHFKILYTVNVDIFACINFRGFMKMVNFACIKIRVSSITGALGYYRSNFRCVHISVDI